LYCEYCKEWCPENASNEDQWHFYGKHGSRDHKVSVLEKCVICGTAIPEGQEFHPAYVKGFKRMDGITCSKKCAEEFLNRGKS
jgi:predicted nucleic acid-binding Zn ribbon protein